MYCTHKYLILITSILKYWEILNREKIIIKNSFTPSVSVNPPPPPALPKDASAFSAETEKYCHNTNKDLSEKYLVFRIYNRSLAKQYCSTTGKPTRSFATERVSLDSV
jgi:hypothetical protein